jgi:heme/copper-type cytochrome/quinol oxidase subunit 2
LWAIVLLAIVVVILLIVVSVGVVVLLRRRANDNENENDSANTTGIHCLLPAISKSFSCIQTIAMPQIYQPEFASARDPARQPAEIDTIIRDNDNNSVCLVCENRISQVIAT